MIKTKTVDKILIKQTPMEYEGKNKGV